MRGRSAGFDRAVTQSQARATRVSFLDTSLGVTDVLTGAAGIAFDGQVTIDADRRRSLALQVVNDHGRWTPASPADPFYMNRLLYVERGVFVGGLPEYVPLGVFVIDRPSINVAGHRLTLQAQDRLKFASRSSFTRPTIYREGDPVGDVLKAIAQDAGMGATLFAIDDDGRTLGADRIFELGANRLDALRQLSRDFTLDAYVDAQGVFTVAPARTSTDVAPDWTFARGAEAIMLDLTKDLDDDQLFNHTLVSGEASDQAPVVGEARDLNPLSPAYNPVDGTGPIGDRLITFTSATIRAAELAQLAAEARLLEVALVQETISIPSVPHPALEVGDAVLIVEPDSAISDTYLLDSVSVPLARGAMTVGTRKLRSLT